MTELASAPGERASDSNGAAITPINHWIDGNAGARHLRSHGDVFNPATGGQAKGRFRDARGRRRGGRVREGAFASWRVISIAKRTKILFAFRQLVDKHQHDIARLLTPSTARSPPTRSARSTAASR